MITTNCPAHLTSRSIVQIKDATAKIKELADVRTQSMEDVDTVLRVYHSGIVSGKLNIGEPHVLDQLLEEHKAAPSQPASSLPALPTVS